MSENNLQFGLLVSNLTEVSYDELTTEVESRGVDLIKVDDGHAILIPIDDELTDIISELAFSDDSEDLRVKFVVYCKDDGQHYTNGLQVNEEGMNEIGGEPENLAEGFELDDFAELIEWYQDNPELVKADIENVRKKHYAETDTPDEGQTEAEAKDVGENEEPSETVSDEPEEANEPSVEDSSQDSNDNVDELTELLGDVDDTPAEQQDNDEAENEKLSRQENRQEQEEAGKIKSNNVSQLPQFNNELLQLASKKLDEKEGQIIVPQFDGFIRENLIGQITKFQTEITQSKNQAVVSIYNKLVETKRRVEEDDIKELLARAEANYEEVKKDIDLRQKQTQENIDSTENEKYNEAKDRYVTSMRPSLEERYDKDHLDDHLKKVEALQAKAVRKNDEEREKQKKLYEEYVANTKDKAVNTAFDELSIDELLEPLDRDIEVQLQKMEDVANQFKQKESETQQKLEAEKQQLQSENQQKANELETLNNTVEERVKNSAVALINDKTKDLQDENTQYSKDKSELQRQLDEERAQNFKDKNEADDKLKEEQAKEKALLEQIDTYKEKLAEKKLQMQSTNVPDLLELQKQVQQLQEKQSQPVVEPTEPAEPELDKKAQKKADKLAKKEAKAQNGSSNWAKNLFLVTASVVLLGGAGLGGYTLWENNQVQHRDTEVVADSHKTTNNDSSSAKKASENQASSQAKDSSESKASSQAKVSSQVKADSEKKASSESQAKQQNSKANSASQSSTVLSVDSNGAKVGAKFYHRLPNGDDVEIFKLSQNVGQYTDRNGQTQQVFITK